MSGEIAPFVASTDIELMEDKEKAFAIEYVNNGMNHLAAAEEVGFSRMYGVVLKRRPLIAGYIAHLMQNEFAVSLVSKATIDYQLDLLYDMAIGEIEVPHVTQTGRTLMAKKFHPELVLKIIQERAKLHSIVRDNSSGTGEVSITINQNLMTGDIQVNNE